MIEGMTGYEDEPTTNLAHRRKSFANNIEGGAEKVLLLLIEAADHVDTANETLKDTWRNTRVRPQLVGRELGEATE
jgi:hypothetical protein